LVFFCLASKKICKMISVLNRYLHGYVVTPVILSFLNKGFFTKKWEAYSIDDLKLVHAFNTGNFKAALKMFQSLGWLTCTDDNRYSISSSIPDLSTIHPDTELFYKIPLDQILYAREFSLDSTIHLFKPKHWQAVFMHTSETGSLMSDFMQSPVLVPLLYTLKKRGFLQTSVLSIEGVQKSNIDFIEHLFKMAGLGELLLNEIHLNTKGQFLVNNIQKSGVVLSYYRLLEKMDDLLFGNALSVFERGEIELHLDRTLNVIGSGEQHNIFFDDLTVLVQNLCSGSQFAKSLKIIDTGCGDGSLLNKIYRTVKDGQNSNDVTVIGIDLNVQALDQARKELADVPFELMVGNIAEPAGILKELEGKGYKKEEMLHIRTFLDHNCPLIKDIPGANKPDDKDGRLGIFVDDFGEEISESNILRNYVAHFKRWRQVVSEKGLVTLEVYSLEPATVNKYLEETENLHFDAIHSLSKQYLLPASYYIITAAAAGLIVQAATFRKYPRVLPYTRISLQHFLPKQYTIRHPEEADLESLIVIEALTLPAELRASDEQIRSRVLNNSEGIYLMEKNDAFAGVLYSQRINNEADLYKMKYSTVESFHNPSGKFVQIISLQILPSFQGEGLANELLSFGLLHNFLKSNIKKIVGVSRCARYTPENGNYSAYIHKKNKLGYPVDPILHFHFEEGAEIIGAIADYRPADKDNSGNGVHISYKYADWIAKKQMK
jgi:hypothetical protein